VGRVIQSLIQIAKRSENGKVTRNPANDFYGNFLSEHLSKIKSLLGF
jgi:hypothetical protein